ncbi:MAG TPA: TonB-dependent receptor plug domain-containing protein, partial [Magnetospirillaceae bacterium]|nr:TonB-dependent receptor plug domain-containing protein [Magnetospirillaceae bacterium]
MTSRGVYFRSLLLASCAMTALPALADDAALDASGPTDEVIVESTILRSKQQSLDLMRQADNVKDVTLEDEIRRLPDANIAEALQRIPGISMESDSGSGRFVNIRGFDGDLNGSFWEGVHLTANNQNASPMGGGRAVAYDVFPAGLVGGLEVVKSTTPSMDAEGIGGQVNMLGHKLPVGGKPFLELDVGGGIESLRDSPVWQGSIAAGTSFGLDQHEGAPTPFRIIVSLAYHEDRRGIDDVEEDYTGGGAQHFNPLYDLQNRHYEYHRITQGGSAELDYDPSERFGLYAKAMSSGYWESATKHEMIVANLDGSNDGGATFTDLGSGQYLASNANATQRFIDTAEHITSTVLTGGGHYDFGPARLDLRGGYVEGTDSFPHSYTIDFNSNAPFAVAYQDADPSHRTETVQTPGASLTDPTQFSLGRVRDQVDHAFDREYSAGGDLTVPLTLLGPDDEAKIGGQARLRSRGYDETDYSGTPAGTLSWSQFAQGAPEIYYNNWYNIGPEINHEKAIGAVALTGSYNSG